MGDFPPPKDPRRAFVKRSRSIQRHANEILALERIAQQPGGPPVPRVLSYSHDPLGPVLALSYEEGCNLADLISPAPGAPPLPPWYASQRPFQHPAVSDLLPLLVETGQAVRALHNIPVEAFGRLIGEEPNPHRQNARDYTRQEIRHRARLGVEKGTLPGALAQAVQRWARREIERVAQNEVPCLVHFDLHAGNIRAYNDPISGAWRLRVLYDFELARGWLPEWDLAALHFTLKALEDDVDGLAWQHFLRGYGPVDAARLRLFEGLWALSAVAFGDRYPDWAAWGARALAEISAQ